MRLAICLLLVGICVYCVPAVAHAATQGGFDSGEDGFGIAGPEADFLQQDQAKKKRASDRQKGRNKLGGMGQDLGMGSAGRGGPPSGGGSGKFGGGAGMGIGPGGLGGPGGGGMGAGPGGAGGPGGDMGAMFGGGMGAGGGPGIPGGQGADVEGGYGGSGMSGGGAPGMGMGMGPGAPQTITLTLKMYPVGEFIDVSVDRPFQGFELPGLIQQHGIPGHSISGSSMGGGAGGGGLFAIPVTPRAQMGGMNGGFGGGGMGMGAGPGGPTRSFTSVAKLVSAADLANTIVDSVSRHSWSDHGGPGTMSSLGETLIVNQTSEVHQQIGLFLDMLRSTRANKATVTIKAIWLTIDEEAFQSLDIEPDQQVNSRVLASLVGSHGQRAQATCFDGETIHIAAGNLRSTIESVIPVVGQIEPHSPLRRVVGTSKSAVGSRPIPIHVMAQNIGGLGGLGDAAGGDDKIGYQPVSRWINYGAVIQVRPKVDADQKMVTLTVSSSFVKRVDDPDRSVLRGGNIDLDSHNLRCQQFQSNVRLKHSTPTLVGGAAFQSDDGQDQTYLIVEAIVNND